jgi:hypothetical protein
MSVGTKRSDAAEVRKLREENKRLKGEKNSLLKKLNQSKVCLIQCG